MAGHLEIGGGNHSPGCYPRPLKFDQQNTNFSAFSGSWQAGVAYMVSVFAQRVLPLLVLAVAVVSVPFLMLSPTGLPRLRNLEEERRRANEEISRLGSQITALRAEVARIKSDPAAVERAARDELGLVRTTEVVFQFSE